MKKKIFIGVIILLLLFILMICIYINVVRYNDISKIASTQEENANKDLNLENIENEIEENILLTENKEIQENKVQEETKENTVSSSNKTKKKNNVNTNKKQETKQDVKVANTNKEENQQPTNKNTTTQNDSKKETSSSQDTDKKQETERCTNVNNHFLDAGNSNKWFNTEEEAIAYYDTEQKKWGDLYRNNEISYEEYTKKCPYRL